MYLAVVMDLHSHRIVGWHIDKRMTTGLISKAFIKAHNLIKPSAGLVFTVTEAHSIRAKNIDVYSRNEKLEQVWEMWEHVETMQLLNASLAV
jgi:hypothetical protein